MYVVWSVLSLLSVYDVPDRTAEIRSARWTRHRRRVDLRSVGTRTVWRGARPSASASGQSYNSRWLFVTCALLGVAVIVWRKRALHTFVCVCWLQKSEELTTDQEDELRVLRQQQQMLRDLIQQQEKVRTSCVWEKEPWRSVSYMYVQYMCINCSHDYCRQLYMYLYIAQHSVLQNIPSFF